MKPAKPANQSKKAQFLSMLQYLAAWILTAALLVLMLSQIKALLLYLALLLIENDNLRPPGWNSSTIVAVDKCTTFLAVVTWLIGVMYASDHIREGLQEGRFWPQTGRMLLLIFGLYAASTLLLFVIG